MGLQKYRADEAGEKQSTGAIPYYSNWVGGPTLALVRNCPVQNLPLVLESAFKNPRTVYITGEPDNYFSLPAACYYRVVKGKTLTMRGYLTSEDGNYVFHARVKGIPY
jgi:hypothetical protein